ncbi:hypothetical protein L6164_013584 [Bauhinia variegata]|uniref:Uncharacterized protein n=1 Tax=Bauhinia variegata TaxID=167791 RepID=A0ACB9NFU5_BAUVA|nr:hypothetical protein L6164_013584 [Bauhinia variegata]
MDIDLLWAPGGGLLVQNQCLPRSQGPSTCLVLSQQSQPPWTCNLQPKHPRKIAINGQFEVAAQNVPSGPNPESS